jgi:sugar porter (SP) family MFS transporter
MGSTEQHHGAADAGIAAPLLPSPAPEEPPRRNMFAFFCATLASMTTILMGYNLALMSGAELFMREDLGLTDEQVEVLSGSMNVFMLGSILAAGWAADAAGRRGTIVLANAFLMAGALAMSLGGTYAALLAARFVTSVGVGFAVVVAPVYAAEISPASTRGMLSSLPEIFVNAGILLSYVSNYALAGLPLRLGWRAMFAAGVVPPVLLAAGVLAMPESPRWLAMRGRDAEARAVLSRTTDTPAEADDRLREIKDAIAAAQQGNDDAGVRRDLPLSGPSSPTTIRRILTDVLTLQFFHQASGIDIIVLYTPLVLKEAGISSNTAVLAATVAVGVVKTGFILVATLFSDRVGRRPLLLASTAGIAVSLTSLAITLCTTGVTTAASATAACVVASLMAYVAAFSVGLGPLAQAYSAEILPLRLRARGTSLGTAVNRLTCGVLSMTFISLANTVSMAGCFFLYAGAAVAAWVFVYVRLPETRRRSLEDMDQLFSK